MIPVLAAVVRNIRSVADDKNEIETGCPVVQISK